VDLIEFLFVGWFGCSCILPVYLRVPCAFLIKHLLLIKKKKYNGLRGGASMKFC
jgi:hypothetical protein